MSTSRTATTNFEGPDTPRVVGPMRPIDGIVGRPRGRRRTSGHALHTAVLARLEALRNEAADPDDEHRVGAATSGAATAAVVVPTLVRPRSLG